MAPKAPPATSQPPPPRMRECSACGDVFTSKKNDPDLIKPCSVCASDYCYECLETLFRNAAYEPGAMLPRCCALIQIHTIIGRLGKATADAYRARLAERIMPDKVYCPVPTCSAFIHEKHLPPKQPTLGKLSLKEIFVKTLDRVNLSTAARFFRTSELQQSLPDYFEKVTAHIDLNTIRKQVDSDKYKTADELMSDIHIIVISAREYNGVKHSVTSAAEQLESVAQSELNKSVDHLVELVNGAPTDQKLFACPSCHIAICSRCHTVAHEGQCDHSAKDHEAAMLLNFGYKRCPRCNHGVKKMYGCPHMQCVCGAHWCYYCEKSIDECTGGCADESEDEGSEGDASEDDPPPPGDAQTPSSHTVGATPPHGANSMIDAATPAQSTVDTQAPQLAAPRLPGLPFAGNVQQTAVPQSDSGTRRPSNSQLGDISQLTVNLDGGGANRWAATQLDFGDEPEEEPHTQIWSCRHSFAEFRPRDDGFYHGDYNKIECNRCFSHVAVKKAEKAPAAKRRKVTDKGPDGRDAEKGSEECQNGTALQCPHCYLVVCGMCRAKFEDEVAKHGM